MKNLKKLFLTSTLLTLSSANFLGAMEGQDGPNEKTPLIQHNDYKPLQTPNNNSSSSSSISNLFTEEDIMPFDDNSSSGGKTIVEKIFDQVAQKTNKSKQTLLKNWEKSQTIKLNGLNIENVLLILKPLWNEIRELDLSFCDITELPKFFTKDNFTKLEVLNLQYNTPNDESLKQIAKLPLKNLNLSYCKITKLSTIFKKNKLPKLEILNLQGNFKPVSDEEEKKQIQDTFKTTKIIFN